MCVRGSHQPSNCCVRTRSQQGARHPPSLSLSRSGHTQEQKKMTVSTSIALIFAICVNGATSSSSPPESHQDRRSRKRRRCGSDSSSRKKSCYCCANADVVSSSPVAAAAKTEVLFLLILSLVFFVSVKIYSPPSLDHVVQSSSSSSDIMDSTSSIPTPCFSGDLIKPRAKADPTGVYSPLKVAAGHTDELDLVS